MRDYPLQGGICVTVLEVVFLSRAGYQSLCFGLPYSPKVDYITLLLILLILRESNRR